MEVISPGLKNLQTYLMNRMLVYVYREFSAAAKRGLTPFIGTDELFTHFPNLSDAIVRKKLKECAYLRVIFVSSILLNSVQLLTKSCFSPA